MPKPTTTQPSSQRTAHHRRPDSAPTEAPAPTDPHRIKGPCGLMLEIRQAGMLVHATCEEQEGHNPETTPHRYIGSGITQNTRRGNVRAVVTITWSEA